MTNMSIDEALESFPIRELSKRTGVNSVTLRAWERRYGLLKPLRTAKGHRLYTRVDEETVHKILYWLNQGVAVGKVKTLLESHASELPTVQETKDDGWREWQQRFVAAALALSQGTWEQLFQDASKQYPSKTFFEHGLLPALEELSNKTDASPAKLCLQSSLTRLITLLKLDAGGILKKGMATLVLCCDASTLMAQLVAWELTEREADFCFVGGVRQWHEVEYLARSLSVSQVVIVAQDHSQAEARRWLEQARILCLNTVWIGSAYWLEGQQLDAGDTAEAEQKVFSNVMAYMHGAGQIIRRMG